MDGRHELSHDLATALEGLMEDRASLPLQVGLIWYGARGRVIEDASVELALDYLSQRVPEVIHWIEINFFIDALCDWCSNQ